MDVKVCSVEDCDKPYRSKGYCWNHYKRFRRNGDPVIPGQKYGPDHHNWIAGATYGKTHDRIRRVKGAARKHLCECGLPATSWAYDGLDPDEYFGPKNCGTSSGTSWLRFSAKLTHYRPLCRRCHDLEDRSRAKEELREWRQLKQDTRLTVNEIREKLGVS